MEFWSYEANTIQFPQQGSVPPRQICPFHHPMGALQLVIN